MPVPILDFRSASLTFLEEIVHTLARLEAHPLTASFAAPFEELYRNEWTQVVQREFELLVEAFRADAMVEEADDGLDDYVDELDAYARRRVKGNLKDPFYLYFFGANRPHDLKRPVLGGQLETMRQWVAPLNATAGDDEASMLAAKLDGLIVKADAALVEQSEASEKIMAFRTQGDRKAFVDKLNALRKSTDGKLAELPHANPGAKLPGHFASRFFKHAPKRGKTAAKELTSEDLKARLAEAEGEVAAVKQQLADALAKEEAEAILQAQLEADKAALAEAEKEAAEIAAKVAALRAKIGDR
ncbi:hypothetical protein [Polyangium aurulentum]|uniref:hypothetical protein n=1 Tax=Polyangium aurulentum TaxID=2567896 RepID=UPI0010AE59ED|nr:hypothetical protein [Polyangium aurulentum]UQA56305.1 hypothetical protein E8A73_034055 [Polyangium aurulentum]